MSTQYVQHNSGQGEKWRVRARKLHYCSKVAWQVECATDEGPLYLPKSEYRLCEPPERLVDVTNEIVESSRDGHWHHAPRDQSYQRIALIVQNGYRLIKTPGGFRVEKKAD